MADTTVPPLAPLWSVKFENRSDQLIHYFRRFIDWIKSMDHNLVSVAPDVPPSLVISCMISAIGKITPDMEGKSDCGALVPILFDYTDGSAEQLTRLVALCRFIQANDAERAKLWAYVRWFRRLLQE